MQTNPSLTSKRTFAHVVTTAALAAGGDASKLPTRMRILKWGANENCQKKTVHVGKTLIECMADPTYPFRNIALDYEHSTWPGSAAYKQTQEPRPVAAFLSVDVVEGKGVYVNVDRWTQTGKQNAENFCDLSAVPLMDEAGNVTAIVSVALTRAGAVPDIAFEQAALAAVEAYINNPEGQEMNWKEIVAKQLGLDPGSTDEELKTAWLAYIEKKAAKPAEEKAAEEKPVVEAVAKAAKDAADAAEDVAVSATEIADIVATAVNASSAALSARLDRQDKAKIIADARMEGKVVALSAELIDKLSVDDLSKHCQGLAVGVPLHAMTPVKLSETHTVSLSAIEMDVCKSLGLSAEDYAKEKERDRK